MRFSLGRLFTILSSMSAVVLGNHSQVGAGSSCVLFVKHIAGSSGTMATHHFLVQHNSNIRYGQKNEGQPT